MIGKIVRYTEIWHGDNKFISTAIVIDYREGYHVKKSWGINSKFIKCPLIKIYWLKSPLEKPPSALKRMSIDWNMSPQYSFGFAENKNNYIVENWNEFKSEWYYADIFEVEE